MALKIQVMSHSHSFPLEVNQALLQCARAARFDFGEDTAMVAVQHMLRQTVDLFETASQMGLNLKNVFALGKIYSNSQPVIRTLRSMGVTVVESTMPAPGEFHSYFERDIAELWRVASEGLNQRPIKSLLGLSGAGGGITKVTPDIL